jgi:LuxR family maltose regulon positive regulatory protein
LPGLRVRLGGTIAPAFVDSLLKDLADERRRTEEGVADPSSSVVRQQSLIEPLSERELDVLRLLAEGLTTPNIAERLYISAGTAKWHTINIYRKLDVHSRVQAVARAHELGLI